MKPPPLVEISWTDARSIYERISWSDIAKHGLAKQNTVGYLHSESEELVRVVHTFDPCDGGEEPDGVDLTIIPRGWITNIRYLTKRPKAAKKEPHGHPD